MANNHRVTLSLVTRLAVRFGPSSKIAEVLPEWLEQLTAISCPACPRHGPTDAWWNGIRKLCRRLGREATGDETESVMKNACLLGVHLGLSRIDTQIFLFFVLYKVCGGFEYVVDRAISTKEVTLFLLLSQFCDTDEPSIRAALRRSGQLRSSGLVKWEPGEFHAGLSYQVGERLGTAMQSDVDGLDDLISMLFPAAKPPAAEWTDFAAMGSDADLMRDLVVRALAEGMQGVNLLLYGPPGTGKTEFAKVLAREVGASLRAIGEMDESGNEPSRSERLSELGIAGRMLGARRDTLLLLDEMEDLFGDSKSFMLLEKPSKVFSNRLLETNPVPIIWTTNSVKSVDPAFLRRMTYSMQMRAPSVHARARIWQRIERRYALGIEENNLSQLAEAYDQAPALVADAMKVAKLTSGGKAALERVLTAAARLAHHGVDPAPKATGQVRWDSSLANCNAELSRIETRLAAPEASRQVSFCLDGPAGTGKSAWARHLAKKMGMETLEKRASDLMSPYVGENEQNIARAFAEARAEGAVLILDEADSFLADRRGAVRNWEVSQVNEMLTWMESHPFPFICTTNLADRLDPATQRRFTFRIRFDPLSRQQLPKAWSLYFSANVPEGLQALDNLTPGDFANVSRRTKALGEEDAAAILAELSREAESKGRLPSPIGFVR